MEHIKKNWIWYLLGLIAVIILAMNWKKWFGKTNESSQLRKSKRGGVLSPNRNYWCRGGQLYSSETGGLATNHGDDKYMCGVA